MSELIYLREENPTGGSSGSQTIKGRAGSASRDTRALLTCGCTPTERASEDPLLITSLHLIAAAKPTAMAVSTLLATFLCTMVLPVLLILVALRLWEVYMVRGRDPGCPSPLPPGSMGLPFLGETLQLILQVSKRAARATSPHSVSVSNSTAPLVNAVYSPPTSTHLRRANVSFANCDYALVPRATHPAAHVRTRVSLTSLLSPRSSRRGESSCA